MKYRHLGATGLKVSEISLGSWVTYGGQVEGDSAREIIHRAFDLGVNLFDTADVYMAGEAEKVVGEALKDMRRQDYVLATKCYFPMTEGVNDRGLSRKHIYESCNASLKRLGVDYIDLYQCHRYDEDTPLEETLRALDDLVRWGKVLYIGVSQWSAAQITDAMRMAEAMGLDGIVSNQPQYNIAQRSIEAEVMPRCWDEGVGLIVYSPLAQGVLTGKYKPGAELPEGSRARDEKGYGGRFIKRLVEDEKLLARVQKLAPVAEELGVSMAQLSLAWILRRPEISSVIVGASKVSQIESNVAACDIELPEKIIRKIDKLFSAE